MHKGKSEHLSLKEKAKEILKNMGFSDNEIFVEHKWYSFYIDVAGIKSKKLFFIECGNVKKNKIDEFKKNKIKYIVLPFKDIIGTMAIKPSTKERLEKLKVHPNQSYDELLNNILDEFRK